MHCIVQQWAGRLKVKKSLLSLHNYLYKSYNSNSSTFYVELCEQLTKSIVKIVQSHYL